MRWPASSPKAREVWHFWFAWRPIRIDRTWVWLETVLRREVFIPCHPCGEYEWEYLPI